MFHQLVLNFILFFNDIASSFVKYTVVIPSSISTLNGLKIDANFSPLLHFSVILIFIVLDFCLAVVDNLNCFP